MDLALENAVESDAAHWELRWDGGLGWIASPNPINPTCMLDEGAVILRRWTGRKYPMPRFPMAVGFDLRPATSVKDHSTAGPADTICWYMAQRVSGGGVPAIETGCLAQPAPFGGGGSHVGLIPNPPLGLDRRLTSAGLQLSWHYNSLNQQIAPDKFWIYTDQGSGTISGTAYASVDYIPGQNWYYWHKTGTGYGTWLWLVLAETAARVKSLTALAEGRGLSDVYGVSNEGAGTTMDDPGAQLDMLPDPWIT